MIKALKELVLALAKFISGMLFLFFLIKVIDWMWGSHSVMLINIAIVCLAVMFFIREK